MVDGIYSWRSRVVIKDPYMVYTIWYVYGICDI